MTQIKENKNNPRQFSNHVFALLFTSALGALTWGYAQGVTAPTQDFLMKAVFPDVPKGLLYFTVAIRSIGCLVGSIIASPIASKYGRRRGMMISDTFMLLTALLHAVPYIEFLTISRFLIGIYIGLNCVFVPVFIGEISPTEIKARAGTLSSIFDSLGLLLAYLLGFGMPKSYLDHSNHWWQFMFLFGGVIPFVRLILLWKVYKHEPAIYSYLKGNKAKCIETLNLIYTPERAHQEYEFIKEGSTIIDNQSTKSSFKDLFRAPYRKALLIGTFLVTQIQFTGFGFITSYATSILKRTCCPHNDNSAEIFTIIIGLCSLVGSLMASYIIKSTGRRTILRFGQLWMMLISILFIFSTFRLLSSQVLKYFVVMGMFGYFLTLGPVKFIYLSEILPDAGVSFANIWSSLAGFVVNQVAPLLMEYVGSWAPFTLFGIASGIGVLFSFFVLKETKGLSHFSCLSLYAPIESKHYNFQSTHFSDMEEKTDRREVSNKDTEIENA